MTIEQAINKLIESKQFKEDCKQDARLRVFLGRLRAGTAKREMILTVLKAYGYNVKMSVTAGKKYNN